MIFDHTIVAGAFGVVAAWYGGRALMLYVIGKLRASEFVEYLGQMPDLSAPAKQDDIVACVSIICMRVEAAAFFHLFSVNAAIALVAYLSGWLGETGGIAIW